MKTGILAFIYLLFFLPACSYPVRYDGPYKGRVVDAETGQPLEGVVVLGVWHRIAGVGAGGAFHDFYDARETVTNKNGEFSIPGLGLKILSSVEPMDVLIFKAGYEYIGMGPWEAFKVDEFLKKKIRWEREKVVIPLKKLTMEERNKQGDPPDPPSGASFENVELILREVNKDRIERGLKPRQIWGGKKL